MHNKLDVDDNIDQWFCKIKNVLVVYKSIFGRFYSTDNMKNLLEYMKTSNEYDTS